MTQNIFNDKVFLTPKIIESCFKKNKITHVDKQMCGNGFTTAFLNITPVKDKVNIIIAPNKAVVISKQIQTFNQRVKFFYKESSDTTFNDADILVFVADSFLMYEDKLKEISYKIDKVLIDEFHSVETQSLFRNRLQLFTEKVKNICSNVNTSIVTVTATPNLYSKIDIIISNKFKRDVNINITKDKKNALKRIKNDIKNSEKVIVFTNDKNVISKLKNYKKELRANFIVGENLMRGLVETVKIIEDKNSNLTIVSSRGFEGFDLYYNDANIYFFEDRAKEHETFYISNLYQAINRNRGTIKYIEYCRLELSNKRKQVFNDIDKEIDNFINDTTYSIEQKQRYEFKKYFDFVIFKQNNTGVFEITKNDVAINLYKERLLYDSSKWHTYFADFLKNRNINITDHPDINNRILNKQKRETKQYYLKQNENLITDLNLFGSGYYLIGIDYHDKIKPINYDIRLKYLKQLDNFLIRKNYDQNKELTDRQRFAYSLLNHEIYLRKLVNRVRTAYNIYIDNKYTRDGAREKKRVFKQKVINIVCQFIILFANDRIYFPKKIIANRDYNLTTEISLEAIKIIASEFDLNVLEADIRTCNPRILYALNGLTLPHDFYGVDKVNKKAINVFLNSFRYDANNKYSKKRQKQYAKQRLNDLGFDGKVIDFLIDRFFETNYKGDLFNFLAFHEKEIINDIRKERLTGNIGTVRRHDSLLIFNNAEDLTWLNNYQYKGVKGWFDIKDDCVVNLNHTQELKQISTGTDGVILL